MANKRKNRQPEEKSDVAEPAPNANPPDPAADAADEDGPELEPRTMWHRARVALLGSIGMLSQEEIEAEEAAERAREAKEAEAAAYEALPWIQKCERYPLKVNLLGIADVKIALDDAIRSILIDEGHFAEDNTHSNRKLILGYVAVVVALVSSAYSYFVPFSDSKALLGKGVFTYFVLVSVMWLYGLVVEKDCLFVGTQSDPLNPHIQHLQASSAIERKSGIYSVSFAFSKIPPPAGGQKEVVRKFEKCVGEWFDVDGRFAASIFRKDVEEVLKGNVMHLQ